MSVILVTGGDPWTETLLPQTEPPPNPGRDFPPWTETPPDRDPPRTETPPPDRDPPARDPRTESPLDRDPPGQRTPYGNDRAVAILLECILV